MSALYLVDGQPSHEVAAPRRRPVKATHLALVEPGFTPRPRLDQVRPVAPATRRAAAGKASFRGLVAGAPRPQVRTQETASLVVHQSFGATRAAGSVTAAPRSLRPAAERALEQAGAVADSARRQAREASRVAGRLARGIAGATNLRHVMLVFAALAVALGIGIAAGLQTQTSAGSGATETVVISAGQSLWEVAAPLTPAGQDVRTTMVEIRELNGLEGSTLIPGQELTIPVR